MEGGASKPKAQPGRCRRTRRKPRLGTMRRSVNARSSSDSSSSDDSAAPSTHARKRVRRAPSSAAASPSNARPAGVWHEARDANGREVWCLDSDEEELETKTAVSSSGSDGSDDDEVEYVPTLRPTAGTETKTSTTAESTVKTSQSAPVVYLVDSDDSDEEEEEVQQQETPSTQNTTTQEEDEDDDGGGHVEEKPNAEKKKVLVVEDDDEDEEEEEDDEDEEEEEEEEEWKPETSADEDETHKSDGDEEEDESADSDSDDDVVIIETLPRKRAVTSSKSIGDSDSVCVKTEAAPVVVKAEPVVAATSTPPNVSAPAPSASVTMVAVPDTTSNALKPDPDEEEGASLLLAFSQHDHEAPPARALPSQQTHRGRRPRHHPRAARRSIVRRRRLDDDHAGMLLFDGQQHVPTSGVVKVLIEFIARSIGPVTSHERRWIDYLLLSKLNTAIDRQADEVITRYSDWMKIALGASDDASRARHRVQREPLLPLPIRYTIRPTHIVLPKPAAATTPTANGKTKSKGGGASDKQRRVLDMKLIEKKAAAMQAGEKRIKQENQTPRRRPAVGAVSSPTGPFSPTSSITSSVSSRAARASGFRGGEFSGSQRELKRQRVVSSPPSQGFAFNSPSRPSPSNQTPMAYLDIADDVNTTGLNRSMPRQWAAQEARTTPAPFRPLSMNPLFTMSLTELRAHINSVQLDGRAKNFEKPLEIVQKLMNHPRNRHGTFNVPVDPVALNLPTYNDIIKNPMDLGTIKLRLEEGAYLERDDYVADVELVFENAMTFNPPRHSVHVDAEFLLHHFDDMQFGNANDRLLKRRKKNSKAEPHECNVCFGNSCVMCEQGCLPLSPPHLQCAGSCGVDIRRGAIYYVMRDGTRVWCAKCRANVKTPSDHLARHDNNNEMHNKDDSKPNGKSKKKKSRGGSASSADKQNRANIVPIELPVELTPKKVEGDVEPWVKCVRCSRWLHQVCGLYNPVYAAYATDHDYVCPLCVWKQRSPNAPRNMAALLNADETPPQQQESSCHKIPKCDLSDFIECFLRHGLQKMNHHEAAEQLHVRVLSFPNERLFMPEGVVKSFDENARVLEQLFQKSQHAHRYPSEIGFTSRGIFLFQRHEGTDVCLFTLFVQEYGEDCELEANRKSVYVAYLDSIRYLKPPEARTESYHLIMMAYFDYIRRHGFERVHIWSCPPQKRISYVFWCRPPFQRTPSAELLRKWYNNLLSKSQQAGIVQSWTNMYDRYFTALDYSSLPADYEASPPESNGGPPSVSTRTTASKSVDPKDHAWPTTLLPPIFDGDFLPAELERILGYLSLRNDKYRRGSRGGKSSVVGTTGGKLAVGEFVTRIKEENAGANGAVTTQVEFKLRDIFKSCAGSINKLKNDLLVVDLVVPEAFATVRCVPQTNVPAWWQQVPRFFGSRFMFHQLCASSTYQFDSLRRAKHSTMMVLHHYFNQRVPQLNVFCSVCCLLITHADYWHCASCERFALCDMCYHREGSSHMHALAFGAHGRLS